MTATYFKNIKPVLTYLILGFKTFKIYQIVKILDLKNYYSIKLNSS